MFPPVSKSVNIPKVPMSVIQEVLLGLGALLCFKTHWVWWFLSFIFLTFSKYIKFDSKKLFYFQNMQCYNYNWTQNYCHIKLRYISSHFWKSTTKKLWVLHLVLSFWYCCALVGLYFQAEKMLKRGGSLEYFWHQILPSHWSKPWSYDQILDFVWWREDTVQFWLFLILTFKARFL